MARLLSFPILAWIYWRVWRTRGPLTYRELIMHAGPSLYMPLNDRYFYGTVSNFAVYDRALTRDEIVAVYNATA